MELKIYDVTKTAKQIAFNYLYTLPLPCCYWAGCVDSVLYV